MEFEWDEAKSRRNSIERGLPFDLAILLFRQHVLVWNDDRRDYGELRVRAVGIVGSRCLHCVYTDRAMVRRVISLRAANRRERDAYSSAYL